MRTLWYLLVVFLLGLLLVQNVHAATQTYYDVHGRNLGSPSGTSGAGKNAMNWTTPIDLLSIQRYTGTTWTTAKVYNDSHDTQIQCTTAGLGSCTADGSGYCNFSTPIHLNANTTYTICADSGGASYNYVFADFAGGTTGNTTLVKYITGWFTNGAATDGRITNINGVIFNVTTAEVPGAPTLTVQINDSVTGQLISGFCINATGTNTSQYLCNATGNSVSFNTSGTYNITGLNITAGNATPQWFNTTQVNYAFTSTGTLILPAHQALLQINAHRLFLNTTIASFNGTNRRATNTTSTSTLFLKATNGSNNVKIDVAGNYSKNITCTIPAPLQTVNCNVTGIHDNWYSFNATDVWNNVALQNFSLVITNGTLGGVLYNQSTTNGSLNFSLLQGYTYFIQFTNPNGTYEYVNVSLAANASYQRYEFDVLPAPSIDITIRDADTNALILENVTIQLINNVTGQTNYTIDGGFFSGQITVGTYTIKLESSNYSQSVYTVTINSGTVYFLTAYLQFAPETVVMQFVDSISSSVVLPDTAVSQERIVNGSWQVISSKSTDITGRTSFRYADDTAYRFTAIKTGYGSKLFTLDPILFSSYTINMERDTALDFDEDFQSVYVGYSPYLFYDAQTNQVNITFASPLGTFTIYNYTIRFPGGTLNGSGTNAVGETFTVNFNILGAAYTDRVNISLLYDTSIGPARGFNYSNGIIISPGDQTFIANQDNTYGLGLLERLIIGTLIIVIVAGLITVGAGPLWGFGMALFIMGFWLKIGFWSWWAAGLSLLVGFALLAGRTD